MSDEIVQDFDRILTSIHSRNFVGHCQISSTKIRLEIDVWNLVTQFHIFFDQNPVEN